MDEKISMLLRTIRCADANNRPDIKDFVQRELDNLTSSHGDLKQIIDFSIRKTMYYEIIDFAREFEEPELAEMENFALKQLGKMRKEAKAQSTKNFIW